MDKGGESARWQGPRSEYPWEQDALEHIKAQMPDAEPYRARQTFTFTAGSGHVREVDLFIATARAGGRAAQRQRADSAHRGGHFLSAENLKCRSPSASASRSTAEMAGQPRPG